MSRVELSLRSDPKYFWSYIKSQKNDGDFPAEICVNGVFYSGTKNIADQFGLYFGSMFAPAEQMECHTCLSNKYFCDFPFNEVEIRTAFKKLKGNRAIGPDGLPAYIIKGCGEFLLKPLLCIFNLSLKTLTYPTDWRISKVIPVLKGGIKRDVTNYRPITLVNAISRVFEIVILNRIYDEVKHSISLHQHGFLPNKSTLTNLLSSRNTFIILLITKHK